MFRRITTYFASLLVLGVLAGGIVGATIPTARTSADCGGFLGLPAWYTGLTEGSDCENLKSPADVGLEVYIWTIVLNVMTIALQLVAYIAVFFVIYGGFKFIVSGGSPDQRAAAMKTILNAIIGMVIAIAAVAITRLIAGVVTGTTGNNSGVYVGDAASILGLILNLVYYLAGAVAVIVAVVAGFNFVTSGGNPQRAATARQRLIYACVGIVILVFASTITSFIQGRF